MHRASIHLAAGHWPKEMAAGSLTLEFDARHRRRIRLISDQGEEILIDLPKTVAMADGDALQLEDDRLLEIKADAELIVEVRHPDPAQLARLAWHLGNRHLAAEVREHALRIRPDRVIEDMLHGFGAEIVKVRVPFQPECGTYSSHGHDHEHRDVDRHRE